MPTCDTLTCRHSPRTHELHDGPRWNGSGIRIDYAMRTSFEIVFAGEFRASSALRNTSSQPWNVVLRPEIQDRGLRCRDVKGLGDSGGGRVTVCKTVGVTAGPIRMRDSELPWLFQVVSPLGLCVLGGL